MKIKVECSTCGGTGQATNWVTQENLEEAWVVEDCSICAGTGKVEILVVDKRVKTKKHGLVRPRHY